MFLEDLGNIQGYPDSVIGSGYGGQPQFLKAFRAISVNDINVISL